MSDWKPDKRVYTGFNSREITGFGDEADVDVRYPQIREKRPYKRKLKTKKVTRPKFPKGYNKRRETVNERSSG